MNFNVHFRKFCLLFVVLLASSVSQAQILDYQNKVTIALEDGTQVILFGKASSLNNNFTGEYYYLPTGLRLSKKEKSVDPEETPQFLFVKYTTDERAEAGGVQGGIMHFLMEWGLNPAQEAELQEKLTGRLRQLASTDPKYAAVTNPKLLGAADVTTGENSFRVISASLSDNASAKLVASGRAPVMPGSKIAVAAKMDKNTTQLLAATFEKNRSITDVSLELTFNYNVLFPAVNGQIVLDWSKVKTVYDSFRAKHTHNTNNTKSRKDDTYSYDEMKTLWEQTIESKAVTIKIDKNTTDDATANKIVEQFMNLFMESLTDQKSDGGATLPSSSSKEKEDNPNIRYGKEYTFNQTKWESRSARKVEVYNLNYRVAIPKTFTLTENLGAWYDGVANNKKCVSEVNLNDKFFQYRDIHLILDVSAEKMFGDEVNYVTVNVRKKRANGEFTDQATIDREYLKKNGTKASMSYTRGNDSDADSYEYKTQWSLRGGNVYPKDATWIKGDWEGVTLAPPVLPRTIQFEADLDQLKEYDISRATLQIRYQKFGEENEVNIPITFAKKETLVEKTIYTDPSMKGYAYRLVMNHKSEGKLATEWAATINDDYVFAIIPESLKDPSSEFFKKAVEIGKKVVTATADGKVPKADAILGIFEQLVKK